MHKLLVAATVSASVGLTGCATDGTFDIGTIRDSAGQVLYSSTGTGLTDTDIVAGLKAALETGTGTVVEQLGTSDGFNGNSLIRIPLPNALVKARDLASKVGLDGQFNDLETKMNRAAELATPKAKDLFVGAIRDMSVTDARGILGGPDDAATAYFLDKTGADLQSAMRPIVDSALAEVGAVNTFNNVLSSYNRIPGAPSVDADLTGHVVEKGSDGIFYYLAEEEKAIREDPLKRTSEILQRVFGGS